MVIRLKYLLPVFAFAFILIFAQEQQQISSKKSELGKIKEEIKSLEEELSAAGKKEKETYKTVENYNRQSFLLNKLIAELRKEEERKESEIEKSKSDIENLNDEIKQLRENYSKYVVSVYKHGKVDEMQFLFSAASVRQALIRYKYLQRFSEQREKDLGKLKASVEELATLKNKLVKEKEEKNRLASQKETEENTLTGKLNERKILLASIRKDKNEIKKEIDAKKNAEIKIKNMISRLIEEAERKRKENEARLLAERNKNKSLVKEEKGREKENIKEKTINTDATYDINLSTEGLSSFASLRGRMNWPISNGKILRKYGENTNPSLNTVTLNYGIDIKAGGDLNVKLVADGIISAIDWIPGYGTVIIVTHRDNYRTVYSHLGEVYVKEGDKVRMGSSIARIGESLDGNVLHFEIWSARSNQNPESWLARR